MIRLITGLPGAGKSVELVTEILAAKEARRPCYVYGVDGLREDLAEPLADPTQWQDLPDGSLVVVDEAQKVWPSRRGRDPDSHVQAMSEHRHRGFDFVIATQHPTMIDAYVRRLTGEHTHLVRRWGSRWVTRFRWNEVVEDPQSISLREKGERVAGRIDPGVFELYKSASLHTTQRRVPWKIYAIPVVLVVAGLLVWLSYTWIKEFEGTIAPDAVPAQPRPASGASERRALFDAPANRDKEPLTAAQFVERMVPRVEGLMWTAPIFDGRKVATEPLTLCLHNVDTDTCNCYTEQITPIDVSRAQCTFIARHGVYDPFRNVHKSGSDRPWEREGSAGGSR